MSENASDTPAASRRILQITDTHLYADPQGTLLGLNTRDCLEAVIDSACASKSPELVVASGDLTHDGSTQACQALRQSFQRLDAPVYCLPGNHDERASLQGQLNSGAFHYTASTQAANWQLVFLDSTVDASEAGYLARDQLGILDQTLAGTPEQPAIVWLHHQPVPVGSRWLDSMIVSNPDEFFAVIDRHPQVRAIVWGHVHQDFSLQRNGVQLLGTPSTCVQFKPRSETFDVDLLPPGYRWIDLHADGSLDTGIVRLDRIPGRLDSEAGGY